MKPMTELTFAQKQAVEIQKYIINVLKLHGVRSVKVDGVVNGIFNATYSSVNGNLSFNEQIVITENSQLFNLLGY